MKGRALRGHPPPQLRSGSLFTILLDLPDAQEAEPYLRYGGTKALLRAKLCDFVTSCPTDEEIRFLIQFASGRIGGRLLTTRNRNLTE
jgi:hypothetical protein